MFGGSEGMGVADGWRWRDGVGGMVLAGEGNDLRRGDTKYVDAVVGKEVCWDVGVDME